MDLQQDFSTRQSRRGFLRRLGTLAGVSLALHACGAPSPRPPTAPVPTGPGGIHSLKHLVIACQENRTFDTYFGAYAKAGRFAIPPGYAQPDGRGGRVRPQKLHLYDTKDIAHDWQTIHREWDHGKMDGFYLANGASVLGYYDRSDLPYYYGLADAFTLCGNYFCYQLGPTLPNRIASGPGQAGGSRRVRSCHRVRWTTRRSSICWKSTGSVGNSIILGCWAWGVRLKSNSLTPCLYLNAGLGRSTCTTANTTISTMSKQEHYPRSRSSFPPRFLASIPR